MKVKILVDSNQPVKNMRKRSAVSYYIEAGKHKILFDLGCNSTFLTNANRLSVDISKIDSVVLSSGFADVGGGLKSFTQLNSSASVYVQKDAFEFHYTTKMGMKFSCGLDQGLQEKTNLVYTNSLYFMDDSIQLISNMTGQRFSLKGHGKYFVKHNGEYAEDSFSHEQYLLIEDNGKNILFLGNPYKGVTNIIHKIESITNVKVNEVFTGFQMLEEALKLEENAQQINECMKELSQGGYHFYTSRQNGKDAVSELDSNLKNQITYISQDQEIMI